MKTERDWRCGRFVKREREKAKVERWVPNGILEFYAGLGQHYSFEGRNGDGREFGIYNVWEYMVRGHRVAHHKSIQIGKSMNPHFGES